MATKLFCSPKSYTRAGDIGTTCICGLPKRLGKNTLRIEAIGSVDELNSFIGLCRLYCKNKKIDEILERAQFNVFRVGADLAIVDDSYKKRMKTSDTVEIEKIIDKFHNKMPVLRKFVLPRGSQLATYLHVARTVCRRAERKIVALNEKEKLNPELLRYINRLSTLLFVLARWVNKMAGVKEVVWS